MGKGRRYNGEQHLNYKKVLAVIIAFIVFIMSIIIIKNSLTKSKEINTKDRINYYAFYKDEKWGILGSNGNIIIEPRFQEMPVVVNKTKDVFLCTYDINEQNDEYKTIVLNSKNEQIFTTFDKVEALENFDSSENVWFEQQVLKVEKNGLYGLIDLEGREVIEPKFDQIETIKGIENSLLVRKDNKVGLFNNNGTGILEPIYNEIKPYGENYKDGYITINSENKYGLVNYSGETILENKYDKIFNCSSDKYFAIEEEKKQKLIDKSGNIILENNFDEIKQVVTSGVVYIKNSKYGLMNFNGEIIIDASYSELKEINNDIFLAKKENLYGLIDILNEQKLEFNYKNIGYNKKAGIYIADREGYQSDVLDSKFEIKITGIISELNTENGFVKIKVNEEYKYYNFKFEEKLTKDIYETNTIFLSKDNGKYGYVDKKGNLIVEYKYDEATELNEYGFAAIKKDGLWGCINKQGNIVIEPCYNLNDNLKIDFIGKWHLGLDLNMNYYCE